MENYLYLLELHVDTIVFSSNLPEYPRLSDVIISGDVGKLITMEAFNGHNALGDVGPQKEIKINGGMSTLFSASPDSLLQKIDQNPFQINLYIKHKNVATANIGWTKDFYTSVKQTREVPQSPKPAVMKDQFLLTEDETNRIMGDITATVKLSCFGDNLQTSFQLVGDDGKYLVSVGAPGGPAYEDSKASSEFVPLTPLFKTSASKDLREEVSIIGLFSSNLDPKLSDTPDEFKRAISSLFGNRDNVSNMTFDIVSLMEKPEEHKYIDLRIKATSEGYTIELDKNFDDIFGKSSSSSEAEIERAEEAEEVLTAETIGKRLCSNKDCPAAKKFKEFGIGPLAKTKGLGGLYDQPSLPVTYGMSQTYGVFDEYGPYGLFSRPKRPSNPFIPKQDNDWSATCWSPKRPCKKHKHCPKLNGGSLLRLRGGGVFDYDDVKSPFHECKQIMDQLDEVLYKYKKALGPCGKSTCPFAPNIVKEACKQMCPGDSYSDDVPYYNPTPQECPPPTPPKPKPYLQMPACGSPKCAYAKYKTGLVDEDAQMELQYLPPAPSGKCGHPKCPSPVEPDLPPIHWDCPEPLPKGKCKNPNCPYLPKEIKCLNAVLAKGPCGNFNCPFAPPDPCDSPYCPFANKDCPYKSQNKKMKHPQRHGEFQAGLQDADSGSECSNPDCPFAEKKNDCGDNNNEQKCFPLNPAMQSLLAYYAMITGNQDLAFQLCYGGATCPMEQQSPSPDGDKKSCYQKPEKKEQPCITLPLEALLCGKPISICPDGTCPYSQQGETLKICFGGADCPLNSQGTQQKDLPASESFCGNPNCPYAGEKKPSGDDSGGHDYHSETRISMDNAPCTPATCRNTGGDLECSCCGGGHEGGEQGGGIGMQGSPTEYHSETRISLDNAPCTAATCKNKGGKLECSCCGGGDGEGAEFGMPGTDYHSETRISLDNAPCTPATCKGNGGDLECPCCKDSCVGGKGKKKKGKAGEVQKVEIKKHKKKGQKYVYSIGNKYPGIQIGHKECIMPGFMVPPKMGWLWNIRDPTLKTSRKHWRPGAIKKIIAERIQKHREAQGLPLQQLPEFRKGRKGYGGVYGDSETSIHVQPKPTLQIKKHDGAYWITMNPLKDPHTLVENESPYMDCTPLQFKIVKNKKEEEEQDGCCCCCEEEEEEEKSSSSDSELEIEFTPPAGIIHPERFKKKKNVVHCDTQYMASDFAKHEEKGKGKTGKGKKGKGKKGKKGKKKK